MLEDIASHQLDLIPWMLRLPVEGVRARYERRDALGSIMDIGLRFAGGVEARCRAGHLPASRERLVVVLDDHQLVATTSSLASSRGAPVGLVTRYLGIRAFATSAAARIARRPSQTQETFGRQLAAWAEALRTGKGVEGVADGRKGARCVAVVESCRRSLALGGGWVAVSPEFPVV